MRSSGQREPADRMPNAQGIVGRLAYARARSAARLLGFREASGFSHAFKGWTGMTPRAARQRGVDAAPTR